MRSSSGGTRRSHSTPFKKTSMQPFLICRPTRSPSRRSFAVTPPPLVTSLLLTLRTTELCVKSTTQEQGTSSATAPMLKISPGLQAVTPKPKSLSSSPSGAWPRLSRRTSMNPGRPGKCTSGASPSTTRSSSATRCTAVPPRRTSTPVPFMWGSKRQATSTGTLQPEQATASSSCTERGSTSFFASRHARSQLWNFGASRGTLLPPTFTARPNQVASALTTSGKPWHTSDKALIAETSTM
mmetsp:Transcript_7157/g.15536  ORF Transcript_7157/g.15536 Transcript_7157/m.15536 type:complete len:240 (+) Transcript_7157:280-999(+)